MIRAFCTTPIVGTVPQPLTSVHLLPESFDHDQTLGLVDVRTGKLQNRQLYEPIGRIACRINHFRRNSAAQDLLMAYAYQANKADSPCEGVSIPLDGLASSTVPIDVEHDNSEIVAGIVMDRAKRFNKIISAFIEREVALVVMPPLKPYKLSIVMTDDDLTFDDIGPTLQSADLPDGANIVIENNDVTDVIYLNDAATFRHNRTTPQAHPATIHSYQVSRGAAYSALLAKGFVTTRGKVLRINAIRSKVELR